MVKWENVQSARNDSIKIKLAGRTIDRMGYGIVWCEECFMGIRLSRIKRPEGFDYVPMDQANDAFEVTKKIKFVDN